jgi:hypothetical protein
MDLDAQRVAIAREEFGNDGHGGKMLDLHLMEQKVAVRMGVDMSTHRFSRDGKSVEEAQGVPQVGRGR